MSRVKPNDRHIWLNCALRARSRGVINFPLRHPIAICKARTKSSATTIRDGSGLKCIALMQLDVAGWIYANKSKSYATNDATREMLARRRQHG